MTSRRSSGARGGACRLPSLAAQPQAVDCCHAQAAPRELRGWREQGAIATGVWKLDVSFDALSALIFAGSGSSSIDATQGPSRVSRVHHASGKEFGVVYDFNDEFDETLYKQAMARRRIYKKHGRTQIEPEGAFSQGISRMFFS